MTVNKEYYYEYLLSPQWKEKREALFKLRGKKCEKCGFEKKLHIHHKTYKNIFQEKLEDLQILCLKCHNEIHNIKFTSKKKKTENKLKRQKKKERRRERKERNFDKSQNKSLSLQQRWNKLNKEGKLESTKVWKIK